MLWPCTPARGLTAPSRASHPQSPACWLDLFSSKPQGQSRARMELPVWCIWWESEGVGQGGSGLVNPEDTRSPLGPAPSLSCSFWVAWWSPSSWTSSTSASSTQGPASRTQSASALAWPSSAHSSSRPLASSSTRCTGSAGVSSCSALARPAPPAGSPTPLSLAQVLARCHLSTSPRSPPCPPPSPGPREPTLPPERRARGAGRGLAWALGARLDRVQVSGLCCRGPGVLPAVPTWYDLSLAPGCGARSPSQLRRGCSLGRDPVPQAALGSLWPEACRHLQGQLPLSAPSSPIAGTPLSCHIRGLGGQGTGGAGLGRGGPGQSQP